MHSRCTLNIRPNVLVLQFACSLAHAPTPSISVTLFFTIVNASELVYLARTLYISLLAFLHLSRFASTNWSSPRFFFSADRGLCTSTANGNTLCRDRFISTTRACERSSPDSRKNLSSALAQAD